MSVFGILKGGFRLGGFAFLLTLSAIFLMSFTLGEEIDRYDKPCCGVSGFDFFLDEVWVNTTRELYAAKQHQRIQQLGYITAPVLDSYIKVFQLKKGFVKEVSHIGFDVGRRVPTPWRYYIAQAGSVLMILGVLGYLLIVILMSLGGLVLPAPLRWIL